MKLKCLLFLILLVSCERFIKKTDEKYHEVIDQKTNSDHLNIVFSHNINGETHPCGCRNFPLGGLPQVKGELFDLNSKAPLLYIDSGDAFFPSTQVPKLLEQSQLFTAKKIAESFDINGLEIFTPGDQDFAYGIDWLGKISKEHKFKFLLSNIIKNDKINSKPYIVKKFANKTFVFLGIVNPSLLQPNVQGYFKSPISGINETLSLVKKRFKDLSKVKLILLSHSGMDFDKKLAEKVPVFDWIVGAHSQAFTQLSIDIGKTKIVQVLSRNHYLGKIKVPAGKVKDEFKVIEVRDELKEKQKNNPMITWLDKFKVQLDAIQLEEQKLMAGDTTMQPANTYQSCNECHQKQTEFWQTTSHSLAFITLDHAKAANNPNCIGCHSLNYKKLNGFQNIDTMVLSDKKLSKYWDEFKHTFKDIKSVRALSKNQRKKYSKKYAKLDKKFKTKHNFANVQCLNCHDKSYDHPFEMDDVPKSTKNYQDKCLKCHTSDQSPEWYKKDDKGIATSVDQAYVSGIIKKIACPKRQE